VFYLSRLNILIYIYFLIIKILFLYIFNDFYLFIYIHGCQFVLLYIWINFLFKIKFYALKKSSYMILPLVMYRKESQFGILELN